MDLLSLPLQDTGWQLVESKHQRQQQHGWLKLQQSLVQTLEELYAMCEGEPSMADSALRYLEQTVHQIKQVQQLQQETSNTSEQHKTAWHSLVGLCPCQAYHCNTCSCFFSCMRSVFAYAFSGYHPFVACRSLASYQLALEGEWLPVEWHMFHINFCVIQRNQAADALSPERARLQSQGRQHPFIRCFYCTRALASLFGMCRLPASKARATAAAVLATATHINQIRSSAVQSHASQSSSVGRVERSPAEHSMLSQAAVLAIAAAAG
jgi:hypothetical protein